MLPFDINSLSRVNRIVAHHMETRAPAIGEQITRPPINISLYINNEQVMLGARAQSSRSKGGEFTTELSGLRLVLMFLEQITGMSFVSQGMNTDTGFELYHRADVQAVPLSSLDVRQSCSERMH
jgi:hypothetical protein